MKTSPWGWIAGISGAALYIALRVWSLSMGRDCAVLPCAAIESPLGLLLLGAYLAWQIYLWVRRGRRLG